VEFHAQPSKERNASSIVAATPPGIGGGYYCLRAEGENEEGRKETSKGGWREKSAEPGCWKLYQW